MRTKRLSKEQKLQLPAVLAAIGGAATIDELEEAFQAGHRALDDHPFSTAWNERGNAMRARGWDLIEADPQGHLIPRLGERHKLSVAGETTRVGYGHNAAGVRWVWAEAEAWAIGHLKSHGVAEETAKTVWGWCFEYPHRALKVLRRRVKEPCLSG